MPLIEVEKEYEKIKDDKSFKEELNHYLETYIEDQAAIFAKRISEDLEGQKIFQKR